MNDTQKQAILVTGGAGYIGLHAVRFLASAHLKAYEFLERENKSLKCNLGTGNGYSVKEVIAMAVTVTEIDIKVINEPRREGDSRALVADASLAESKLGWIAVSSDLNQILQTAWNWIGKKLY